jgi:hypothetical protein
MPAPGPVTPTLRSPVWDAKVELYRQVYEPFAIRWFAAFEDSPERKLLLEDAREQELVVTITAFNVLFHRLAAEALDGPDAMIEVVLANHRHVLWVGDEGPGESPDSDSVRRSLTAKLQRNISLGVLEALLCLESAYRFGHDHAGLRGDELAGVLRRSRSLYGSLAVLHDDDERRRIGDLTGRTEAIEFPAVGFADVLTGRLRIPAGQFKIAGGPNAVLLRYVGDAERAGTHSTPTMRCPAHRPAPHGGTYNDSLWALLIDLYRQAGRFESERPDTHCYGGG